MWNTVRLRHCLPLSRVANATEYPNVVSRLKSACFNQSINQSINQSTNQSTRPTVKRFSDMLAFGIDIMSLFLVLYLRV